MVLITSAKRITLYLVFVCLSVSLVATSSEIY